MEAGMVHPRDSGPPLDAICNAIVDRYHAGLHRALPRIRDSLGGLTASSPTPKLRSISMAFAELADRIEEHLAKEENLLFPAIESLSMAAREGSGRPPLPFATVLHPIRLMEAEHLRIEAALDRLREAARAVAATECASPTWHTCVAELSQLDIDLRQHHRKGIGVSCPVRTGSFSFLRGKMRSRHDRCPTFRRPTRSVACARSVRPSGSPRLPRRERFY
jgi:iron-sulfur cluster repair protein YtfE (RIC family)